jgi:hypothetical protein
MNFLRFFRTSQFVKRIINKINPYELQVPIGHFYSPVPDIDEVRLQSDFIFENKKPLGIEINFEKHLKYIQDFSKFYNEIPYTDEIDDSLKYKFANEMFGKSTGVLLYSFIRHLNPKRIIEVGSGHSSALMYDVNRLFYNDSINLTFIEPFPERLRRLFKSDIEKVNLIEKKVQEVDLHVFKHLKENDILFIDSSHVSKVGSDVNKLLFEILPILNTGVYIHIHDIFYPFEYPKSWINNGTYWNELYLLRAFLMYNNNFSVEFFNTYAIDNCKDALKSYPLFSENIGGSIWIKKIQ